jgi:Zn-finger nucleic acid-binding protein
MTTAIKEGFQGVVLPRIRTLIIPEHGHEILKCCPKVTKVWCNRGDGNRLVTVIGKYCKEVQEMRGFSGRDGNLVKSELNNSQDSIAS